MHISERGVSLGNTHMKQESESDMNLLCANSSSARTILAAAAAIACASPTMGITSFFDGVFNNSDWAVTTITNANGTGSFVMGAQSPAGGNPNEFRRVSHALNATGPNSLLVGVHLKANAFYNPAISGAISSIAYSEDSINFSSQGGNGQGTGLAILQSGRYYLLRNPILVMPYSGFSTWSPNVAGSISASDLHEITNTGTINSASNPDFSASGGVMQLGFWRGNSGNISYDTSCGIDNWNVRIIPAPGALALAGIGGLMAARRRR